MSYVQSVIIPRAHYSRERAQAWIVRNGYKAKYPGKGGPDVTINYYRYRQASPNAPARKKRTITLPNTRGIKLIVYFSP